MSRRTVTSDEVDVVYNRRIYCYLQRADVTSKIKRVMRRRERYEGKREMRREVD